MGFRSTRSRRRGSGPELGCGLDTLCTRWMAPTPPTPTGSGTTSSSPSAPCDPSSGPSPSSRSKSRSTFQLTRAYEREDLGNHGTSKEADGVHLCERTETGIATRACSASRLCWARCFLRTRTAMRGIIALRSGVRSSPSLPRPYHTAPSPPHYPPPRRFPFPLRGRILPQTLQADEPPPLLPPTEQRSSPGYASPSTWPSSPSPSSSPSTSKCSRQG